MVDRKPLTIEVLGRSNGTQPAILDRVIGGTFDLDEAKRIEGVKVYHAGTRSEGGRIYTSGGRVLSVTARGSTLVEALERAYFVAQMIKFEGKDYRKDIGKKGLAKQR